MKINGKKKYIVMNNGNNKQEVKIKAHPNINKKYFRGKIAKALFIAGAIGLGASVFPTKDSGKEVESEIETSAIEEKNKEVDDVFKVEVPIQASNEEYKPQTLTDEQITMDLEFVQDLTGKEATNEFLNNYTYNIEGIDYYSFYMDPYENETIGFGMCRKWNAEIEDVIKHYDGINISTDLNELDNTKKIIEIVAKTDVENIFLNKIRGLRNTIMNLVKEKNLEINEKQLEALTEAGYRYGFGNDNEALKEFLTLYDYSDYNVESLEKNRSNMEIKINRTESVTEFEKNKEKALEKNIEFPATEVTQKDNGEISYKLGIHWFGVSNEDNGKIYNSDNNWDDQRNDERWNLFRQGLIELNEEREEFFDEKSGENVNLNETIAKDNNNSEVIESTNDINNKDKNIPLNIIVSSEIMMVGAAIGIDGYNNRKKRAVALRKIYNKEKKNLKNKNIASEEKIKIARRCKKILDNILELDVARVNVQKEKEKFLSINHEYIGNKNAHRGVPDR